MSKLSRYLGKTQVVKGYKKIEKAVSNSIPHQHSADRRAANEAVSQQIDYYKQAKESMAAENKRADTERADKKRRIGEKQIRSMKRAYRSPGFLDESSDELGNKLG